MSGNAQEPRSYDLRFVQVNVNFLASGITLRSHHILNVVQKRVESLIDNRAGLLLVLLEFLILVLLAQRWNISQVLMISAIVVDPP